MTKLQRKLLLLAAIAAFAGLWFSPPVFAGDPNQWCGPPLPPKTPTPVPTPPPKCQPKDDCHDCSGSPCYVATGTYVTTQHDLSIRTIAFPISVGRNYRSTHGIDGPMGFGWSSSVTPRLYYALYLFSAPNTYQKQAYVIMPDGGRYLYTDSGAGAFTPPVGRYDTLIRNADGSFDLRIQRTMSVLHFGPDGGLQTLSDDYGNKLTWTYDVSGRVQQVADSAGSGRYLNVTWGPDGRISAMQDSAGRLIQYTYNPLGALETVTDAANRITTYSYMQGRFSPLLTRVTDNWSRVVSDITYDSQDRVSSYTDEGETYSYTYGYGGSGSTTSKTDSAGNLTLYPFAGEGLVSDVVPPVGGSTHTDRYPDGSVELFIDGVGVKTFYTYTADGSPASVTRDYQGPAEVRFDYEYDPGFPGRVTSITARQPSTGLVDPTWHSVKYDYYQPGDPAPGALHHAYRIQRDGVTLDTLATYIYDIHGRLTSEVSATGGVRDFAYDGVGNLYSVTGAANNDSGVRPMISFGYDSAGRVTSSVDPVGKTTTYGYDALDRQTAVLLPKPSGSSTLSFAGSISYDNYDAASSLLYTVTTDPNGLNTSRGDDQYGRAVREVDALGRATVYSYDHGLLSTTTDANGNITAFGYDGAKRLTVITFPDGVTEHYGYSLDGQLNLKTDRKGVSIQYQYDEFKRMTHRLYPGGGSIVYTYSGADLAQIVDSSAGPAETHLLGYDTSYRIISETQAGRGTVTYQYNAEDRRLSYAVEGGPNTTYSYYPDGSLDTIVWSPVVGQFKFTYRLTGQQATVTLPNGQSRSATYDDQGRLTQLINKKVAGGNIATYKYGYDLDYSTGAYTRLGQQVSLTATVPSQGLTNALYKYEFDSALRLTRVTYPAASPFNSEVQSWTYDALGNRLTSAVNGVGQTYTYQTIGTNPNNWQRLLNDGVNAYTYDANGSVIGKVGPGVSYTFGWNPDNRLASIAGSASASYSYDYQGRRTRKVVGSVTSDYLYSAAALIRETGATTTDYLFAFGFDKPLAMSTGGSVYYYIVDGLGSATAVTDTTGTVRNKSTFDVWGKARSETIGVPSPFAFTARESAEAGMLFFRERYYDPSIGRFTSEDPLAMILRRFPISFRYAYVDSNPIIARDPTGMIIECTTTSSTDREVLEAHNNPGNWVLVNVDYWPKPDGDVPDTGTGGAGSR